MSSAHEDGRRFGDMLSESVRALGETDGAQDSEREALRGCGQAADGQVRVLVGPDGRLREVNLNPRVMRMASEDLAREILTAVNAAVDDLRTDVHGLDPATVPVPTALARSLEGVHDDVMRRMDEFAAGIESTVRRLEER
ncbi:YbaB/EbfC family nucleoid-associated protein [Streptosporangium sandarakinum]|uniref:YbaB/EbfC family nucleoid-associated protein n=1 Tax=Streptosporangium sandarakinum TaxID=1260955 RepID=UPI003715427E